jgi:hypothetical protein
MPNYASKLGEAVGHAVETEVQRIIQEVIEPHGLFVDEGGARPGKRESKNLLMINDTGTAYQIDLAVENKAGDPLIFVESKYIRYKKHNRDKASWTCVAHHKLRTTYPSVRKSIAVLMGQWSETSRKLMNSFGVELLVIPFSHMVKVLGDFGIEFDWPEDDNKIPRRSWAKWEKLSTTAKSEIARRILEPQAAPIRKLVLDAVEAEDIAIKNIEKVELLLQTAQGEYFVKKFKSARDAAIYLLGLTRDTENVQELLR